MQTIITRKIKISKTIAIHSLKPPLFNNMIYTCKGNTLNSVSNNSCFFFNFLYKDNTISLLFLKCYAKWPTLTKAMSAICCSLTFTNPFSLKRISALSIIYCLVGFTEKNL